MPAFTLLLPLNLKGRDLYSDTILLARTSLVSLTMQTRLNASKQYAKLLPVKITDTLLQDHRAIEQMLAAIEVMCKNMAAGRDINVEHLRIAMEWIRDFKGGWHLTREENILFPALANAGAKQHCTIGEILVEHKREREQFMYMAKAAANLRVARSDTNKAFCRYSKEYIDLIRAHIHREEDELYPLADKLLDESKQKEIRLACQKLEDKMGKQWLARMMDILKQLSAAYPDK